MILVRHGQSEFNVVYGETGVDPGIADPGLTALGVEQAEAAGAALAAERAHRPIERLLASPYRRTLETAEIVAAILDVPVTIEPLVREWAAFTCDIGTPRAALVEQWPGWDFTALGDDVWWHPIESRGPETEAELQARCTAFVGRVADTSEWQTTAVITHWGFIRALTGEAVPQRHAGAVRSTWDLAPRNPERAPTERAPAVVATHLTC